MQYSGTAKRWPSNAQAQVICAKLDMGLGWHDIKKIIHDSMNHAFCSSQVRDRIQKHIDAQFDIVLAEVSDAAPVKSKL